MSEKNEQAKKSIMFFYNCATVVELNENFYAIKESQKLMKKTKSYGMLEIFRSTSSTKTDRRGTLVGCVVAFAMAFSGIAGKFIY